MTSGGTQRWLKRFVSGRSGSGSGSGSGFGAAAGAAPHPARTRIVCLPHAGGAATAYQGWARHLPGDTELLAVQYPGRQDRMAEPCIESMAELADAVCTALTALPPLPTALFGHSMGSLVAYETVVRMERRAPESLPVHLFVSGSGAPHRVRTDLPALDDESLIAYTRRQNAVDVAADQDPYAIPELRELLLPSLRADFTLLTGYRPAVPPAAVPVPVTALGGDQDAGCPVGALPTWADLTTTGFASRVFPGGHFYLQGRAGAVASLVASAFTADATPRQTT
ncbi:thioesterase II family protein [Streptomyces sp. NPDC059851]|uniref:thioesterase II family protein n=1 Tax=Streptomyces sp. NPDC059851 TaxID=3346971 RepID=UPI003652EA8B